MKTIVNINGIINENRLTNFIQNTYGYDIIFTVYGENNNPLDLTGFDVYFQVKSFSSSGYKINGQCSISNNIVTYTIQSTDFDEIGLYKAELDIIDANSKRVIKLGMFAVEEEL